MTLKQKCPPESSESLVNSDCFTKDNGPILGKQMDGILFTQVQPVCHWDGTKMEISLVILFIWIKNGEPEVKAMLMLKIRRDQGKPILNFLILKLKMSFMVYENYFILI